MAVGLGDLAHLVDELQLRARAPCPLRPLGRRRSIAGRRPCHAFLRIRARIGRARHLPFQCRRPRLPSRKPRRRIATGGHSFEIGKQRLGQVSRTRGLPSVRVRRSFAVDCERPAQMLRSTTAGAFCKPPMTSAPAACLDRVSSLSRFSAFEGGTHAAFSASTSSGRVRRQAVDIDLHHGAPRGSRLRARADVGF